VQPPASNGRHFKSGRGWLDAALLILLLGAAFWLRVHNLAARPMHADEANQAVKLGEMLEGGRYRFDPLDHHGPTLYYFAQFVAEARGESTLAKLTEFTVRLTPALAGVGSVALLWLLLRPTGRGPAWMAAVLLTMSPAAVYYSRYFIQETLLVAFTLGAFVCGQTWWRRGGLWWAGALGLMAGLMLATKASALVYTAAALLALATCGRDRRIVWRDLGLAGCVALLVATAFYSSFGGNPAGLRDALVTPFGMLARVGGGESGHEKPWWYYARLFVWQRNGGYLWDQTVFILPALIGLAVAWRRGGLARFIAVYTLAVAVLLSLTPYKTPWQVVNVVPGLCGMAAVALTCRSVALAVSAGLIVSLGLGWQTRQAVFQRPADERNPYAYVHTVPDMLKVPALAAEAPPGAVKVIGREYWPLPWYLRARSEAGYWAEPPADCDGALVFASVEEAETVRARLKDRYQESFLGLRPGVLIVVFTRVGE
jgi:uncharacterized protein (TIGR03663 family)